jgi:hypothetical protein
MGITVTYGNGLIIHYDNVPEPVKLQFHNTPSTLASVPGGYRFEKPLNSSEVTVAIEKEEATSLSV